MQTTIERLRRIMDTLGFVRGREFAPETRFAQDLGLDSLEMVELGMEVEDEFDLVFDLDDDLSARWPCVGNLVAAIDAKMARVRG